MVEWINKSFKYKIELIAILWMMSGTLNAYNSYIIEISGADPFNFDPDLRIRFRFFL